jgi:hypothetical protein
MRVLEPKKVSQEVGSHQKKRRRRTEAYHAERFMKLDSASREGVYFAAQSEEAAEAHDQRTPALRIDMRT